jgi:hypothetical protein
MAGDQGIIPVETSERVNKVLEFSRSVQIVEIRTVAEAEAANTLFRQIIGYIGAIETERKRVKEPYLQSGRDVDDYFKPAQSDLENLKSKLNQAILAFKRKQEEERRAEQKRLDDEAAAKQWKLDEQARIEREKAEELRRQAAAATSEAEVLRLREQAIKADARADIKEEKANTTVAPVAQVVAPTLTGTSVRQNWKYEVTDQEQLVKHLVDNKEYAYLMPNTTALNALAKITKKNKDYPGGRIFNDETMVGRRFKLDNAPEGY